MAPWVLRIVVELSARVFVADLSVGGGRNCWAYALCTLSVHVCLHCACCCFCMLFVQWFHLREMKTRTLSEEERGIIVGMRTAGMSTYCIAHELEMSQSTVFTVWKNYCERGTVVARKPTGRAQKLSIHDKRDLARILIQNRHLSLVGIIEQMRIKVCKRTLSTYIKKLGFGNRVAARKPFLSRKHKADRLAFAKAHKRWTLSDWRNIMWTDESSFEIGKKS